jgi:hypothetical protein
MTTSDPDTDAALDDQIRSAADVRFDDVAVSEAVLARIHASRRAAPPARPRSWGSVLAPAAFASVLLATPFIVATYPLGDTSADRILAGLATGDPFAIAADAGFDSDLLLLGLNE